MVSQGYFNINTNTIEGVWSRLKRVTNHFTGYNGMMFNKMEEKGINITDYINGIICTRLFYMEAEHFN